MKRVFIFAALALVLFSCKKEITKRPSSFVTPRTVGSYWIYQYSGVDAEGNVTPMGITDTLRIVGDSLVNGHLYTVYRQTSTSTNIPSHWLTRDSSGYIVDPLGNTWFSLLENVPLASGTLPSATPTDYSFEISMGPKTTIQQGGQVHEAHDHQQRIFYPDGSPVNSCGDASYTFHTYFVSGIGQVQSETAYIGQFQTNCSIVRRDLVDYHIAP